jgi:hypothetical protein
VPGYIASNRNGTNYCCPSAKGVRIGVFGSKKKDLGDFRPFDDAEVYKFIGIPFANGL